MNKRKLFLILSIVAGLGLLYVGRWFFLTAGLCGGGAYLWWKFKHKKKDEKINSRFDNNRLSG
jgi:hypothetical protein